MTDAEALGILRLSVAKRSRGDVAQFDRLLDRFSVATMDPTQVSDGMQRAAGLVLAESICPRLTIDETELLLSLLGVRGNQMQRDSIISTGWAFLVEWLNSTEHAQRMELRTLWPAVDTALRIIMVPPLPDPLLIVPDDHEQALTRLRCFEAGVVAFIATTGTYYGSDSDESKRLAAGLTAIRSIIATLQSKTAS